MTKPDRSLQIAVGAGLYVLINIVLATSGAALSTLSSTSTKLAGLGRALSSYYFDRPLYLLVIVGATLVVLTALALLLGTMQMWSGVISIARAAVPFLFPSSATDDKEPNQEETPAADARTTLTSLLFDKSAKRPAGLVWRFLRLAMYDWALILLLQLFAGTVSALMGY